MEMKNPQRPMSGTASTSIQGKATTPKQRLLVGKPVVKFTKGSFKTYQRDANGDVVRMK